jgi:hypothetical protein
MGLIENLLNITKAFTFTDVPVFIAIYWSLLVVYRYFFHPLSKIPGPPLAAITYKWQGYQEAIKGGGARFVKELPRLHKKYGTDRHSY